MLNTALRKCKPLQIKVLLQHKNVCITSKRKLVISTQFHSCLCRHTQDFFKNARTHSTQSDQHRQKVVMETTEPKIVIDNKVLPDEKILDEKTLQELWKKKVLPYAQLARWDKPIGVYLLYWPCTWSIALGSLPGNVPIEATLQTAGLFLAGAGLMRGAGCTINDLLDKDIDGKVERTKARPLVSGAVTDKQAIAFLGAQLTLALGILLQLNCYSVLLGASSMLFVVTYPLAKRFTNYPQIFLGATFNWGALLGYSALQGSVDPLVCGPLYMGALAWTVVYDTIYAHQDKDDDARIGMKSTAITFGDHTKPILSGTLAASAACLASVGHAASLAWPYYAAIALYTMRTGHQIYTLDVNNPNDCAKKFKSNSMVGIIILLGILGGGYRQYVENRQSNRGKEDRNVTKSCVFS